MIPEEKVREVAGRISIHEVVADYVQLRRAGANFVGLCPFHAEKTPSFNVNPAREIFHCFGCGAGGNAFSFIMKIEGLGFPEAVKHLARKAGIEIEERQLTPTEKQAQSERQEFQRINELTLACLRSALKLRPDAETARKYLADRGVDSELVAAYRLGFAPERGDIVLQTLKSNGINLETAEKLGVVRKSDRGWYDQFRNRLIFPISDSKGEVIAFAGRVLDTSLPKYINSPESPLYHKSSVLFGMDMALPSIRTENAVIIVEGYFDHLALYRAGIKNVVATCGTALTPAHTALIKRHAAKVFILFDSDSAGQKATIKSMELFIEQKIPVYVIALPSGDDPDSFLARNTPEEFYACRDKARPAFEYFIHSVLAQIPQDSVDSKVRILDEITPRFRKIIDPVERDLYEKEICRLLGITIHAFRKRFRGMNVTAGDMNVDRKQAGTTAENRAQEMLLSLMVAYHEARAEVRKFAPENLFDGDYLELAQAILMRLGEDDDPLALHSLLEGELTEERQRLLSRLVISDGHLAGIEWRAVFDQCGRSREKVALQSIRGIASRLAGLDPESDEYAALLLQADALRTRKSKL